MPGRPKHGMQSTVRVLTGAAIATMMALAAARPVHAHEGLAREALGKVVSGSEGVAVAGVVVVRRDAKGRERALAQGCAEFAPDGGACARPLAVDMRMRVASVSKFFVAVGALQLVDAGKLDLDADVSTVLGYELRNPAHPTSAITLRQLLAHTSTLRDAERYNIAPPGSLRDLLADAGRFEPAHAPGRHFNYANINFGVIGALIERASGQRFDRFMNENVLAPAGIRAGFNWSGIETTPRAQVVTLYRKRPPDAEVWEPTGPWRAQVDAFEVTARAPSVPNDYVLGLNPTLFSPQGGLRISAKDVARFIDLTLGAGARAKRGAPRVDLKPATRAVLCRPVFDASLAAQPGAVTGNDEGAFYTAFGVGAQPKPIAGRLWCGHFAEAYGLKGGALYDARRRETLVYFVTGYGDDPPLGDKRYPGLDAVEAAAFDAALLLH